jgi:3-isopropylmalate dehydrogenase
VLEATGGRFGFGLAWTEVLVGGAGIDAYGTPIRPEDLEVCRDADAVLLGAVGGPKWDDPNAPVRPEQGLFALRGGLQLFANLRPVTVEARAARRVAPPAELLEGVDMLIVRELTSGPLLRQASEERQTGPDGRVAWTPSGTPRRRSGAS